MSKNLEQGTPSNLVALRISPTLKADIDKEAKKRNMTASAVMRDRLTK